MALEYKLPVQSHPQDKSGLSERYDARLEQLSLKNHTEESSQDNPNNEHSSRRPPFLWEVGVVSEGEGTAAVLCFPWVGSESGPQLR